MGICTSLILPRENGDNYVQIITDQYETGIIANWYLCDEKFDHVSRGEQTPHKKTEEEFHTELRKGAAEKNHLVTSHCTNPELNPEGYRRNLSDIQKQEDDKGT